MGGLLAAAPFAMAQSQSQTGAGQYGQTQTQDPAGARQQYGQMQGETPKVQQSHAAAKMLEETAHARQAIKDKNQQMAVTHVNQALEAAGKIQTTAGMIPIYTELEQTSVIGPLQAARGAQTPESTTASREAPAPATAAREQKPGGMAVRDVEGGFTSINVDMSEARTHLDAAKTALQDNNLSQADTALQAVQSGVSMMTVEADLPLVKARQNLAMALTHVKQGRMSGAQAPLKAAADALDSYRQMPSAAHSTEAAQLSRDIHDFVSTMKEKTQSQASDQIQQWWNHVADWTGAESAAKPEA